MADGSRSKVGELPLGAFLASSEGLSARVVAVYRDAFAKTWVSFNGEPAFVTSGHPVSTDRGFVPAGALVSGDVLHLQDGTRMVLKSVSSHIQSQLNVNIETEGHRPYYVNRVLFGSYPSYPAAVAERR